MIIGRRGGRTPRRLSVGGSGAGLVMDHDGFRIGKPHVVRVQTQAQRPRGQEPLAGALVPDLAGTQVVGRRAHPVLLDAFDEVGDGDDGEFSVCAYPDLGSDRDVSGHVTSVDGMWRHTNLRSVWWRLWSYTRHPRILSSGHADTTLRCRA